MIAPMNVKRNILVSLIVAEKSGRPITLKKALERWGDGSAWESAVDSGYVSRYEHAVTVTNMGRSWLAERCPEINIDEIPSYDYIDGSLCEWDRMTKGQRISLIIFLICIVLWGAPILDVTCGTNILWIMPYVGVIAVITGLYSGAFFLIIRSCKKK